MRFPTRLAAFRLASVLVSFALEGTLQVVCQKGVLAVLADNARQASKPDGGMSRRLAKRRATLICCPVTGFEDWPRGYRQGHSYTHSDFGHFWLAPR